MGLQIGCGRLGVGSKNGKQQGMTVSVQPNGKEGWFVGVDGVRATLDYL
jgi:hypothetical protein